jgi:hypothetical protein
MCFIMGSHDIEVLTPQVSNMLTMVVLDLDRVGKVS